jgi:hypothetical protein
MSAMVSVPEATAAVIQRRPAALSARRQAARHVAHLLARFRIRADMNYAALASVTTGVVEVSGAIEDNVYRHFWVNRYRTIK